MSGPTVKFCLDHPHKLLQIFLAGGRAGRFGLVNPGHPSKYSPICLFSGDTLKIVIDSAKKKIQTFFYIEIFRGVLWTTFYTNSPWWLMSSSCCLWKVVTFFGKEHVNWFSINGVMGISIIYGTKLHVKIWTHVVVFSHGAKLIVKTCWHGAKLYVKVCVCEKMFTGVILSVLN